MFASILEDLKRNIQMGNMVTRIILVNVFFFALIKLIYVFTSFGGASAELSSIYQAANDFISLPANFRELITQPWAIFTHMFAHTSAWDLIWNMLIFYWFGTIVGDFLNNQRVLPIYLLGGLAGMICFIISENLLFGSSGVSSVLIGATAARLCFVFVAATLSPDYTMQLLLLGPVKIKYIALVMLLIDLFGAAGANGNGYHFAHLGGAFMGLMLVYFMRKGVDLTDPLVNTYNKIAMRFREDRDAVTYEPKLELVHVNKNQTKQQQTKDHISIDHQEKLDQILDKINAIGFDKLTEEERAFLEDASKKH